MIKERKIDLEKKQLKLVNKKQAHGWKKVKLGDVVKFKRGYDLPRKKMFRGNIPVAGSNGIIGYHNKVTTTGPGVTIGRSGNIGFPKFYKNDFWAHNTTLYIKNFYGNYERFVFYLLQTLNLSILNSGSAVPTLNRNYIHELEIFIPSLKEQKAIAEVLFSLDDKIELLHKQNKTLEDLAQTFFRKYFIEEAQPHWQEKPLGKLMDIAIGRTPPRKEFHWFSKNPKDWKWLSIKDMKNKGAYIFDTSEYLTTEAVKKFNIPIIPENTVILSFKMTLGRVNITTREILSNEAIAHFKFTNETPFSVEYLYLFLKQFNFNSLGSTSSIVTAINSSIIKSISILIPDHRTVDKFSKISKPLFNKIFHNQSQILNLKKTRDTLLPKLMNSTVKIKH